MFSQFDDKSYWHQIIVIFCLGLTTFLLFRRKKNNPVEQSFTDGEPEDETMKLVLIVRDDLKMGKGKIAAQCSHGTLGVYRKAQKHDESHIFSKRLNTWLSQGQAKIVLKDSSLENILKLKAAAKEKCLCTNLVHDAGRTQIAPNTATVLAIGPGPERLFRDITGHLKLL